MTPEELANFVFEKARKNPKVREKIADVQAYEKLRDDVGWKRLRDTVLKRRDNYLETLARRLLVEDVPQREIDWHRGFFAGAIFVLTRPEMAERSLETAARMAYVAAQEELLTAEEGESPYA